MKIKTIKTVSTDRLFLVSSAKLMECMDSGDIKCRDSEIVEDAYHKDWFFEFNGSTYFTPPAAYIKDGRILFINGRHRAVLLARHLESFPFLIGNVDLDHCGGVPKSKSLEVMDDIKAADFEEHTTFNLPELQFGDFEPA